MSTATRSNKSPAANEAIDLIEKEMKERGCSRSVAASKVFKLNPGLRQRILDEANNR